MGKQTSGTIVSVGYEGRTLNQFIADLRDAEVEMLVDVRLTPISRKPGFSKTKLSTALADAGIEYQHHPSLGNPKENREPFRRGLNSARQRYSARLANDGKESFDVVTRIAGERVVALLCYERNHNECHRSCIIERVLEARPTQRIVML